MIIPVPLTHYISGPKQGSASSPDRGGGQGHRVTLCTQKKRGLEC